MVKRVQPMMLKTGTKNSQIGFMLMEVLVTVAILSLSTILISQNNLLSGSVYGRYVNRLSIQNWAEEKIWETKQEILESETSPSPEASGNVELNLRNYAWSLQIKPDDKNKLFQIALEVAWSDSGESRSLSRYAYVLKPEKP